MIRFYVQQNTNGSHTLVSDEVNERRDIIHLSVWDDSEDEPQRILESSVRRLRYPPWKEHRREG